MEHPEGLTDEQEKLADLLFTTKIHAKVRRRSGEQGNWTFTNIERDTSPIDFAQEGEFAIKVHDVHPDAPLSPIYVNLRNLPDALLDQIALAMADIPETNKPAFCVGIPKAGEPIGLAYARITGIPHVQILAKEENADARKIVLGPEHKDIKGPVRIIDDLITHGHTKIETVKAIRSAGLEVSDLTVLMDREQGGKADLAAIGVELRSVFTLKQLLNYYRRVGHINEERYDKVMTYLNS